MCLQFSFSKWPEKKREKNGVKLFHNHIKNDHPHIVLLIQKQNAQYGQ